MSRSASTFPRRSVRHERWSVRRCSHTVRLQASKAANHAIATHARPPPIPARCAAGPCERFEWARDGTIVELRSGLCLGIADDRADGVVAALCGAAAARFEPAGGDRVRLVPTGMTDGCADGGSGGCADGCLGLSDREDQRLALIPCASDPARLVSSAAPSATPTSPMIRATTAQSVRFQAFGTHMVAGGDNNDDDSQAHGAVNDGGGLVGDSGREGFAERIELLAPAEGEQLLQAKATQRKA